MFAALTGNDESLKKDWRMIAVRDCDWLRADAAPPAEPVTAQPTYPAAAVGSISEGSVADEEEWDHEAANGEENFQDEGNDVAEVAPWHDRSGYHPQLRWAD